MPDLDWNAETWDGAYDWENGGEEWSQAWGGSEAQWFGSLYPRLHRFLPAGRVLEIAPGYGRWTKFLIGLSESFVGVDLSDQCVAACKTRFAASRHASFLKTDGTSLAMTEGKFDLVFSFDSLVHAEFEIMQAYIREILARLNPGGLAFLHHSNFLDCQGVNTHRRAGSVSAGNVAACIRENGGSVLLQEKVNWGSVELTDSLTLFGQAVCFPGETIRLANGSFMDEAH
ncbi:class I SAM-dependent methyltransferase, partial [Falsiroseomonas sp. E2-1-a20]|uniref:class I SAM-dependent methyltransferase n=1 Tax=Falsiroseomonas sp. E2-1-a20 TaxID=3239300 RepID=UPI003F304125